MTNAEISDNFSLLAKLMDVHGDNNFKTKSYASAAFNIDRLTVELKDLPTTSISNQPGIGVRIANKIVEQLTTGSLAILNDIIANTPEGILQMIQIKGIGAKKINCIWKEMGIETLGELLYACNENRLTRYKGFGEKTQGNIKTALEYFMQNQGNYLHAQVIPYCDALIPLLKKQFPEHQFHLSGELVRQLEIITELVVVTDVNASKLNEYLIHQAFSIELFSADCIKAKSTNNLLHVFYCTETALMAIKAFEHSCSSNFWQEWQQKFPTTIHGKYKDGNEIFDAAGIPFIPTFLRENEAIILQKKYKHYDNIITANDVKGIIHSHSKWSDGNNTLQEMAIAAKQKGFEYLVISDHSKSAFYANGLVEASIEKQHIEIDKLNEQLQNFTIYKSIECDILNDGSLDYEDDVLASFDIVIASIHSNLNMTEEKAMQRLISAIENPYTSILGHLTGRLLLSRKGYPVDHKKIIEACAANDVVIELNAHPRRLDIDWRWIEYAVEKGVLISINPDAHSIEGFDDIKAGISVAQKAALTSTQNLSSFSKRAFEAFIIQQHQKR